MGPEELRILARDRRLITPEIHPSNDFYGHAYHLKRYAGLSFTTSLKVAIEHGIVLNDYVWEVDLKTEMPIFLCASESHARTYEAQPGSTKKAIAIGPLIKYVTAPITSPVTADYVLAFPAHSTHRINTVFQVDEFCDWLESLRTDTNEVIICLYWKDILQGLDRHFVERGFECVTAGHMYDIHFLPRLYGLLESASIVVTNEVGTHILYSVLLNKPVWIKRQDVTYTGETSAIVEEDAPDFVKHPNVLRLLDLFSEPTSTVSGNQRQFIEDLAGAAHVRECSELRAILADAEEQYNRALSFKRKMRHKLHSVAYYGGRLRMKLEGW